MIFNKDSKGAEELRTLSGNYWKSNDFGKVRVKVELATEDVAALIGSGVIGRADTHYQSNDYHKAEPSETDQLNDNLVQHIQLPVSFLATMWHYQANDVSHEDSGRKVKIDANSEKLAWEWMYARDDAMALNQYHKTLDRLIRFLNANQDNISEWKDSDAQKNILSLFIRTADHFNQIFPIDDSAGFFLRLAPFMREVERKYIKPVFGAEKFDQLKESDAAGTVSDGDKELIEYACDAIPLLTMSIAVKRLSVTVMPQGVVQNYFSAFQSRDASQPVTLQMVNEISKTLYDDGKKAVNELKKIWSAQAVDETEQTITDLLPSATISDKFVAL